jgi:hypothetical protein
MADNESGGLPVHVLPFRRLRGMLPLIAAVLLALAGGGHFAHKEHLRVQERRLLALEKAWVHGQLLERRIDQAAASAALVSAVLEATRSFNTLDVVAERVMSSPGGVSAVQIEANDGLWRRYSKGRLGVVSESEPVGIALPRVSLTPFGTVSITASLDGIAAMQAVHTMNASTSRYWGLVTARVTLQDLRDGGRLSELEEAGYFHQLVAQSEAESTQVVLSQSGKQPVEAVTRRIALPGGGNLFLRVSPKDGLTYDPFLFIELALIAVASILLGGFLYIILRQTNGTAKRNDDSARPGR